jgi:hypothetical protein
MYHQLQCLIKLGSCSYQSSLKTAFCKLYNNLSTGKIKSQGDFASNSIEMHSAQIKQAKSDDVQVQKSK